MEYSNQDLKLKAKAILIQEQEERKNKIKQHWNNLKKFKKPEDIPSLPETNLQDWKNFFVPKLIEAGAIPKKYLVDGKIYYGQNKNARVAQWDEERNCFFYIRKELNEIFEDKCSHFEDNDGFPIFVPLGEASKEEYELNKIL